MGWGNFLSEFNLSTGIDWGLLFSFSFLFRFTLAFVPYYLLVEYLSTGYYISIEIKYSIEIKHDPDSVLHFFEGILYLLGVETAEL